MPQASIGHVHLTACEKSSEFEARDVPLELNGLETTKIGRAVARVRTSVDNLIFDCKVLSRTHAVLWYEDDKFYLRDTKSSNGTFVNNVRLSKGGEESAPHEIFSGDIVQLGVDIVENQKKATFSCVIAMCRLVHADGRESIRPDNYDSGVSSIESASVGSGSAALSATELFQLHQYIREASHREQALRAKLTQLEHLLSTSHAASDSTWQALIDEDRLLSRIETLEARITLLKKTATEDRLRDEAEQLLIEKEEYEAKAKESVRKILQEKMEATQKLTDVERALITTERQNDRTSEERDAARSIFLALDDKFTLLQERHDVQAKELAHGVEETHALTLKDENHTLKARESTLNDRTAELTEKLHASRAETSAVAAKLDELRLEVDGKDDGDALHGVCAHLRDRQVFKLTARRGCEKMTMTTAFALLLLCLAVVMAFNGLSSLSTNTNDVSVNEIDDRT